MNQNSSAMDRTAADKNYVAEATRRRRRILRVGFFFKFTEGFHIMRQEDRFMNSRHPLNGSILIGDSQGRQEFNTQLLYFTCSFLSRDDQRIYMISDQGGSPNVIVRDMFTGKETQLTDNTKGILKSYVYFDGTFGQGLGKASVCLDYNPETEGAGLDKRPIYDIDERIQKENLSSYLCVYDTESGRLMYEKKIPRCWITHVQFNPVNPEIIMYNHEWPSFDCGIRRIWMYDHSSDEIIRVRTEGGDTLGNSRGFLRKAGDWVCHEMWSDDGKSIIYHGGYENGPAMVGKYDLESRKYWEIALPDDYNAYGHFTMDHKGNLVCDGYFKYPWEIKKVRENSTDNGPDPHKKDAEYICKVIPDWDNGILTWVPLCKHESDWLGQDAHPHPIYSHAGDRVFFNSRMEKTVNVYCVSARTPQQID